MELFATRDVGFIEQSVLISTDVAMTKSKAYTIERGQLRGNWGQQLQDTTYTNVLRSSSEEPPRALS